MEEFVNYISLLCFDTPILIILQITEDLTEIAQSVMNKLYTEGSFVFGSGFDIYCVKDK